LKRRIHDEVSELFRPSLTESETFGLILRMNFCEHHG
jgi:hypothetical protein